jgi:RNA polymerase sigma-70 factor (ECF subfamily)
MTQRSVNPLVLALAAGEPDAFATLYGRLGGPLYRFARVMLRDRAGAEDAVHDLFVQLVQRRDQLRVVQDLEAYVFAMLRYNILHRVKKHRREQQAMEGWTPAPAAAPNVAADIELEQALAKLPVIQRELIALKFDGELTFAQIADVLQISPNTAASRYRYALEKLRSYLDVTP